MSAFTSYGEGSASVAEVTVLAVDPRRRQPDDAHRTRVTLFASAERDRIVDVLGAQAVDLAGAEAYCAEACAALAVLGILWRVNRPGAPPLADGQLWRGY